MIRGFYTAASGIVTQEKKLNNVSNNLANVSTVGYKRDNVVMGTFGEHMTVRMNAYQNTDYEPVGPGVYMQIVDEKYTDYAQGGFEATTRPLDMSLMGQGFFVIQGYDGEEVLTRDGQFSRDDEGYLILPGFGRVQGENGDIEIEDVERLVVGSRGTLYMLDEDDPTQYDEIDQLMVVLPNDYATLRNVGNGQYVSDGYTIIDMEDADQDDEDAVPPPIVRQYQLERSNVNLSDEMTTMIASQRSLQSCSQLVKMYDDLAGMITSQISKI